MLRLPFILSLSKDPGHVARLLVLLSACVLVATSAPADARARRVVLVVAGNTSIRDIADPRLPHLRMMLLEGSAALMNVRTGRPSKLIEPVEKPGMEPGCVALGAGAMAAGGAEVRRAGDAFGVMGGVPVPELYACRVGHSPGRAEVLHTEAIKMWRINATAAYRARPGALGSALRSAGIKTAVVGNSDLPGEIHREAVAIAMDRAGLVDRGEVGSARFTISDPQAPYGVRTDPDALVRRLDSELHWCRFMVVDFGDTLRADSYAELCTDLRAASLRREAAERLDRLIGVLATRLDFSRDALILLSPSSRSFSEIEEERLTYLVIRGAGFGAGMLTSPSTRRGGVVTVCDVAPTVLAMFGLKPPREMIGRPAVSRPGPEATEALLKLNLDASKQGQRQVIMRGASVCQSVLVVLVTAALLLGARVHRRVAAWAALVPLAIPLAMLYLPLFYNGGRGGAIAVLVLLTAALVAAFGVAFRTPMRALGWLCAATVASLIVDLARGAPLMSSSIAGYSLVEGARYYGVGNELAGTLLGAAIIGLGVALSAGRVRGMLADLVAAVVFGVVFAFDALPGLGADAGGAASAAPAMATAFLVRRGWKPSARGVAAIALLAVLAIGGLFAVDAARGGGSQSHIGRIVGSMGTGGLLGIVHMAQRKLALNFMLLSTSAWSRLLGLSLVGSLLLYLAGRRAAGDQFLTRDQNAAAVGCCIGIAGAFLFNDSGVLSAATCSVFLWSMLAVISAIPPVHPSRHPYLEG